MNNLCGHNAVEYQAGAWLELLSEKNPNHPIAQVTTKAFLMALENPAYAALHLPNMPCAHILKAMKERAKYDGFCADCCAVFDQYIERHERVGG